MATKPAGKKNWWRWFERLDTLQSLWSWVSSHAALFLWVGSLLSGVAVAVWSFVEQLPTPMIVAVGLSTAASLLSVATTIRQSVQDRARKNATRSGESPETRDRNEALLRVTMAASQLYEEGRRIQDLRSGGAERDRAVDAWLSRRREFTALVVKELRHRLTSKEWSQIVLYEHYSSGFAPPELGPAYAQTMGEIAHWRDTTRLMIH
jgi:hypothetical protein